MEGGDFPSELINVKAAHSLDQQKIINLKLILQLYRLCKTTKYLILKLVQNV